MAEPFMTRRELIGAGLVAGAGAVLAACSSGTGGASNPSTSAVRRAAGAAPAGRHLNDIDHVVFLIQENRSFDHYLGSYRGVRGFDDHHGTLGPFAQDYPPNTTRPPSGKLLPFHLDTATTNAECTNDVTHDWGPQHRSWAKGAMSGFATEHLAANGPNTGPLTMGYYTRQDLAFYYALADAFTVCDAYHCSVMGPTDPNRLFSISATNDPDGKGGGPVLNTNGANDAKQLMFSKSWTTMPERLQAKGISWKVYQEPGTASSLLISNNDLLYFKNFADPSSVLHQLAFNPSYPDNFDSDVAAGTLPQVSWVLAPLGKDEHPPASPEYGEATSSHVLSTLASNPSIWSRTVLFITWDENGGFFDHVAPPVAPPRTPGEYVTVDPLPSDAQGIAGPIGLGFRVPCFVVSPFSRGGYVCSTTFDHTSLLRFLETRFGVEVPNLSAWRRGVTGDLTTSLGLDSPPDVAVPALPTASFSDPTVARECPPNEIVTPVPTYPLPAHQAMPTQEPGASRRRPGQ